MAWIERIAFVSIVIAIFLEEGFCDDICPNGITNITGQTSGELEYPMAGTYGVNETKCWRIEIPKPYYRIGIILHRFDFEECLRCECDALSFANRYSLLEFGGDHDCERLSTRYLDFETQLDGSRSYQAYHAGENLYIRLKSDDSFNYRGFKFSYIVGSNADGRRSYLNVSEGEISTPKFGSKNYPANFEWQWFLLAPEGHQINITFSEFELEQSENCKNDYLEIREAYFAILSHLFAGIDAGYGAILARPTCGTNKPQSILSTGNMVWVHFKSDSNSTTRYKGFKATFTSGQARSFLVNNASTLLLLLLSSMAFTTIFI
ncbi:dorsal-ventral patterning tolloid-like protein 1 isoform X1 [Montipora foliosa]|uniref:dorsal-ventral patterning tolloid-like protein 1 isoform X1 n=1 Tax=Montipora foliosa TaxID=591990 RepID=UPI0035F13618